MTIDSTRSPGTTRAKSSASGQPRPLDRGSASATPMDHVARTGVIEELTDHGRFGDLAPEDLVPNDEDWLFYEALWRIDPKLVWIAAWAGCGEGAPDVAHPVRELRRRVAGRGVGRSAFARLAGEANAAGLKAFEFLGNSIVEGHLRLETLLDQALPWEGPAGEWIHRWRPCARHFDYERSRIEFTPAQAAYLVKVGLDRMAAGSFQGFLDVEFPVVLRYWAEIVRGDRLARWETLLERARLAHAQAMESERAKGCRWDSGVETTLFDGYRITALSDSYALWREGLAMRHCIADYAQRCIDDGLRVFHLQSESTRDRWTLALAPESEDAWRVHEIRGPRNLLADAQARVIAQAWALAYGVTFPPGEHGLEPLFDEDDGELRCAVCTVPDCQDHLVANLEVSEGMMDGCLYDDWEARRGSIDAELQQALLADRPNPEWPSELASIFDALREARERFIVQAGAAGEWMIDNDAWHDACCEINIDRLLLDYLKEWLSSQPETVFRRYEISTAPGLSWLGAMVYADDPEAVRQRFLREFCVTPALLPPAKVAP